MFLDGLRKRNMLKCFSDLRSEIFTIAEVKDMEKSGHINGYSFRDPLVFWRILEPT
jgi:hypothetical protein